MRRLILAALAGVAALVSTSVQAAVVQVTTGSTGGIYSGTECGGTGGFSNCYATQSGVVQGPTADPLASSTIYKLNSDGSKDFSSFFPTISGSEFLVNLVGQTLSFTYTAGTGDPAIHYFSVKQSNSYVLFYDAVGITSGSVNLNNYFPNNPGYSHITFFDTTNRGVPEPATWAMMLLGFGAMGASLRRSHRRNGKILQIA